MRYENNPEAARTLTASTSDPDGGKDKSAVLLLTALNALRQWWKVAVPLGLALAAGAIAIVYATFVPQYRAESMLQIDSVRERVVFSEGALTESRAYVNTQLALMRSPVVMGRVVSRPEIAKLPVVLEMDAPVDELAQQVSISGIGRSDLYNVAFTGPNPKHSAVVVNAVVDEYLKINEDFETQRWRSLIELLEGERDAHAAKIARLRDNVRELAERLTGENPFAPKSDDQPLDLTQAPLATLQQKLVDERVRQAILRANIAAFEKALDEHPVEVPAGDVEAFVEDDAEVQRLKAKIAANKSKRAQIVEVSVHGEKDPKCRKLAKQIEEDEQALEKKRAELREQIAVDLQGAMAQSRQDELEKLKGDLESSTLLEEILHKQYEQELTETQEFTGDTLELEFAKGELARAEHVFELIAERVFVLQTEREAKPRVKLLRPADVPVRPREEMPLKKMVLAGSGAFAVPFLLAFGWEYRVRRISNSTQLSKVPSLPVIAEIANFPARASGSRSGSRRSGRALRLFEESVHGLRTSLVLSESFDRIKVLAVTSAVAQEGKTSVASQLAISYAKATGNRVLLIDGDMRAADIHNVFSIERAPGLADVLQGECRILDAVDTQWSENVHVLPAGNLAADPHALVGNGALTSLIGEVREAYDLVILDTPPILAASESLVFAKRADAVLICAMRDVSRLDQVSRAYGRLTGAGISPYGAVFSGVGTMQYAYNYGSYEYL